MKINGEVTDAWCDGDIWCYRIAHSVQHTPPEPPQPWFTVKWSIHETLDKVRRKYPNAAIHVMLTDERENYREAIAVTRKYKGNRNLPKPYYWRKVREFFESLDVTVVSINEEADDLMSMALMKGGRSSVIVSEDKDLKNTPGLHWNDKTGAELYVNEVQAYRNFYTQLLTGDTVDNIPGCPRIGAITAPLLLQGCTEPTEFERAVGLAYACAKGVSDPEAMMIEMGQLLWMRRKEGELWNLRANGFL